MFRGPIFIWCAYHLFPVIKQEGGIFYIMYFVALSGMAALNFVFITSAGERSFKYTIYMIKNTKTPAHKLNREESLHQMASLSIGIRGITSASAVLPKQDYDVRSFVTRQRSFMNHEEGQEKMFKREKTSGDFPDIDSKPINRSGVSKGN